VSDRIEHAIEGDRGFTLKHFTDAGAASAWLHAKEGRP
jgi:hypothetical protein